MEKISRARKIFLVNFIFGSCLILNFVINILTNFQFNFFSYTSSFFTLIISALLCYMHKENNLNFILFLVIFYFNYSIIFSRYFFPIKTEFMDFYRFVSPEVYNIGISVLLLFMSGAYYLSKYQKKHDSTTLKSDFSFLSRPIKGNVFITISLIAVLIFIFFSGFNRSSFGDRGASSSLYESSVLVFIFAYYYIGNTNAHYKILNIIISIIAIGYSIQGFIYGERIVGVQILIVLFSFTISKKVNTKQIFLFFMGGLFFMTLIGTFRGSYKIEELSVYNVISSMLNRNFTFDGGDLAYYSSLTFIMTSFFTDFQDKLSLILKFIFSIFLGSSNIEGAELTDFTRKYYMHWNGGYFPFYFYFYFGWIGVALSTLIFKLISFVNKKNEFNFYGLLKILIVATSLRWYAYTPQILFRNIFIFSIVYYMLNKVDKVLSRKKSIREPI